MVRINMQPASLSRRFLALPIAACLLGAPAVGASETSDPSDPNQNASISSKSTVRAGEGRASERWTADRMRRAKVVEPILLDPDTLEPIEPDSGKTDAPGDG